MSDPRTHLLPIFIQAEENLFNKNCLTSIEQWDLENLTWSASFLSPSLQWSWKQSNNVVMMNTSYVAALGGDSPGLENLVKACSQALSVPDLSTVLRKAPFTWHCQYMTFIGTFFIEKALSPKTLVKSKQLKLFNINDPKGCDTC